MALAVRNLTGNAGNTRDAVSIPGLGRSLGEDGQGCKAVTKDLGLRQWLPWGYLWLCPIEQLGLPFISPLLNQGYYTSDSATELYSGLGKRVWICRMDHNTNWFGPHPSLTWNAAHCTSSGCIRFLLLIIYKARIGKRKFLYILFRLAELVRFYLRIFIELVG